MRPKKYGWKNSKVEKIPKSIDQLKREHPFGFVKVQTSDGELVWIPRGVNPDLIFYDKRTGDWPYSKTMGNLICEKIAQGGTALSICREEGMPPYVVVSRWRNQVPEFKKMYEQAILDRAEFVRDVILKIAELAEHGNIQASRLKIDTLKWAASVDDPENFGQRVNKNVNSDLLAIFEVAREAFKKKPSDGSKG